jgi:putative DNA primase/helicase
LSSGELSLSAHANESGGAKVKAGAEVRLLTVAADAGVPGYGLFENIHGFNSPAEFSDHLKAKSKAIYGTPLRAFLRWLCENREQALNRVAELQELFGEAYIPRDASGEITRAAVRFSLLASAGELATESGVTGWVRGEATKAAGVCFKAWLDERGSVAGGDVESGVRQALAFIEQQGSRFQMFSQTFAPPNRVGFVETAGGYVRYILTRGAFEDIVCMGHNFRTIREELIRRGFMVAGEAGRPGQQKVSLPGLGRPRVYVMQIPEDAFDTLAVAA